MHDAKQEQERKLNGILAKVESGEISPDELIHKRRLSGKKLAKKLGYNFELRKLSSRPSVYQSYRRLKFLVEGIDLSMKDVEVKFNRLISELNYWEPPYSECRTRTVLQKCNRKLYDQVLDTGYSNQIFYLTGLCDEKRVGYIYLTDDQLVTEVINSKASNWTELHNLKGSLEDHLRARNLRDRVMREIPSFVTHWYEGLKGHCYRSKAELILGNLLVLIKEDFEYDVSTGVSVKDDSRPLIADFYLSKRGYYIELEQSRDNNPSRGSRRVAYANRSREKHNVYCKNKIPYLALNLDPIYSQGTLDSQKYVPKLMELLAKAGVHISQHKMPPMEDIGFENNTTKKKLLNLPIDKLMDFLANEGVDGISTLQNHFSSYNHTLQYRKDYQIIARKFKEIGFSRRSNKIWEKRAIEYVDYCVARSHAQSLNKKNQGEWFAYAKANKKKLKDLRIPASVQNIYRDKGWKGWHDFLGNSRNRKSV